MHRDLHRAGRTVDVSAQGLSTERQDFSFLFFSPQPAEMKRKRRESFELIVKHLI